MQLTDDKDVDNCRNIVQPDISVICDKSKLTDKGCTSAHDMIIEVVYPFNPANDYIRKLSLYAAPEAYIFNDIVEVGKAEEFLQIWIKIVF